MKINPGFSPEDRWLGTTTNPVVRTHVGRCRSEGLEAGISRWSQGLRVGVWQPQYETFLNLHP